MLSYAKLHSAKQNPARSLELCEDLAGEGAVRVVDEPGVDPALVLLRGLRHRLVLGQVGLRGRGKSIESCFFSYNKVLSCTGFPESDLGTAGRTSLLFSSSFFLQYPRTEGEEDVFLDLLPRFHL